MTFNYELDDGRVATVTGRLIPASRGYRDSLGIPEEPDEPASFEIDSVSLDVSDDELERIEAHAMDLW